MAWFIVMVIPWAGILPLHASTCVDCHTNETLLEKNLSGVKEKKSALTSGAG